MQLNILTSPVHIFSDSILVKALCWSLMAGGQGMRSSFGLSFECERWKAPSEGQARLLSLGPRKKCFLKLESFPRPHGYSELSSDQELDFLGHGAAPTALGQTAALAK